MPSEVQQQGDECPVCGHPYDGQAEYGSQAELRVPTHAGVCVQRYGTNLEVYLHDKLTIELEDVHDAEDARQQAEDSLLSGGERAGPGGAGGPR